MKASLKFFFILVAFCFTLGCQSEQEKKEAFFHSADKYYAQKEYKKAEILKRENKLAKKSLSRVLELSNDFEGHEEAKQLINELNE